MDLKKIKNIQVLFLLFLLAGSCSKSDYKKISESPRIYENYIGAYTSGFLNVGEVFAIDFINPNIDSSQIGSELDRSLYEFQPDLPGKFVWKSLSRLEFIPDPNVLETNGKYSLLLNLDDLFPELAKQDRKIEFELFYVPLSFQMDWSFPRPDPLQDGQMYLEGLLTSNAAIPVDKIHGLLKAMDGMKKTLQVVIQPTEQNPKQYFIRLNEIQREKHSQKVSVDLHNPWNENSNESFDFDIPALNEFKVMGVKSESSDLGNYKIFFSNFLNIEQDIRGLIKFQEQGMEIIAHKELDHLRFDLNSESVNTKGIITVGKWISDKAGQNLSQDYVYEYNLSQEKPRIKFLSSGSILPYSDNVIMPFEAINLDKIDVEIFKLYSSNVLYNLHFNIMRYEDNYNMVRLGKVIYQNKIELNTLNPESNIRAYKRYALDLSKIVKAEPGAFYQLRLSFKPDYSRYACTGGKPDIPEGFYYLETGDPNVQSTWREYAHYDYGPDYSVNDTQDPCSMSYYYRDNFAKASFYASNISLTVKYSENNSSAFCLVNNIQTGQAVQDAAVIFYDSQLQLLAEGKTDNKGMVQVKLPSVAKIAVARSGDHYAYLQIEEGKSMSQSEFDVAGVSVRDGLKASIYTERGVWRPGDSIMYNVVLFADDQILPDKFPVELIVKNPMGKTVFNAVQSNHILGLYSFLVPTSVQDVTGIYSSQIKVGQNTIYKNLLIETIKPNRYALIWNIDEHLKFNELTKPLQLNVSHLTGGAAADLKAEVKLKLNYKTPEFEKYKNFIFTNPEEQKTELQIDLANSKLDDKGNLNIKWPEFPASKVSGNFSAQIQTFLTDASGELSTDYFPCEIQMFNEYVGIKIPKGIYGQKRLQVGEKQLIEFVTVDGNGTPLANRKLKLDLFKVKYEWWYEMRSGFVGGYQRDNYKSLVQTVTLVTDGNGKATWPVTLNDYDRFYITASNLNNAYTSGDYFYTSWPYGEDQKEFANIIEFQTKKEKYNIGEMAALDLPPAATGTYHVCLIKANSILSYNTIPANKDGSVYEFKVEKNMVPNVYLDVSYIQSRSNKENDLPLRLYGVKSLKIEDTDRQLQPLIKMSDVLRPEEKFTVEVKEERGKEMAYQLFIVDEGLLSLTRFKTPNPYNDLMAKEALSILSWDNYDEIIGSFNGKLEQVFSIGGDQAIDPSSAEALKRFKPVLLKTGPKLLGKGQTAKHEFTISNYTGAVRVMLVANTERSAGMAEKSVKVKQEIMVQLGLPRVFSVADEIALPVTVYANENGIQNIDLKLNIKGDVTLIDEPIKQIKFRQPGVQTVFYRIKGKGVEGKADFTAAINSGKYSAQHHMSIPVVNPNPLSKTTDQIWIQAKEKLEHQVKGFGIPQTRKIYMEISGMPGLSVSSAIDQLVQYPHGCLEQTISSLFPQLYLSSITEVDAQKLQEISQNITIGIDKLRRFQLPDGSFGYWPGNAEVTEWGTCYAGHFLVTARKMGYKVPEDMINRWQKYQWSNSQRFTVGSTSVNPYKLNIQAYSLYALSLAGKPNYSAMNQLYQLKEKTSLAVSLLAGSFVNAGKKDIAQKLVSNKLKATTAYRETGGTFGSDIRDEAIVALSHFWTGNSAEAATILHRLAKRHPDCRYYTTQELSFIFQLIVALYSDKPSVNGHFKYTWNGTSKELSIDQFMNTVDLKNLDQGTLILDNKTTIPLSINIVQSAKEDLMDSYSEQKNLELRFFYESSNTRKWISGESIKAIVEIRNTSATRDIENLAMDLNFPSGLELINQRWELGYQLPYGVDYQDYRDNRLINYFNLKKGERISWTIPIKAGIPGQYPSPLIVCEAMYDPTVYAKFKPAPIVIEVR